MKTFLYLAKDPDDGVLADLENISSQGQVTVVACLPAFVEAYTFLGYNAITADQFFTLTDMKFDVIIGNPPYGKNCNLPPKFLNRIAELGLSKKIIFVVPRTMRKKGVTNGLHPNLHLTHDKTLPDDTFRDNILTCVQTWEVKSNEREKIREYTKDDTDDFEFLKTPEGSDLVITRVANAGVVVPNTEEMVLTTPYYERSPNTTYFIKVKNQSVADRLISLEDKFIEASRNTVGLRSLSIDSLIEIYLNVT